MINYIRHLPIGFFGSVVGLATLSIAWHVAHNLLDVPAWAGVYIGYLAIADFLLISVAYIAKVFLYWENVKAEFIHPVTGSLFSLIPGSFIFIAGILLNRMPAFAAQLWHAGVIMMFLFMIVIVHEWMHQKINSVVASPTWLVPVTILSAIPFIGFSFEVHAMWLIARLSFAGGLILAIALFVIVLSGLFFGKKQSAREDSALFILSAPFVMSFLSYIRITGSIDEFANVLYYASFFLFIALLPKLISVFKSGPFRTSWWGTGFPLSLMAIAALRYVEDQNLILRVPSSIALGFLALSSLVNAVILILCVLNLVKGKRL